MVVCHHRLGHCEQPGNSHGPHLPQHPCDVRQNAQSGAPHADTFSVLCKVVTVRSPVVGDPHRLTTPGALGTQRSEHVFRRRSGVAVFSCHNALTFLQEAGYPFSPVHRAVRRPYTRAASGMKITSRPTHQASACPMAAASGWLSSSPRTALITTEIG
jgi:hypothetical protein